MRFIKKKKPLHRLLSLQEISDSFLIDINKNSSMKPVEPCWYVLTKEYALLVQDQF